MFVYSEWLKQLQDACVKTKTVTCPIWRQTCLPWIWACPGQSPWREPGESSGEGGWRGEGTEWSLWSPGWWGAGPLLRTAAPLVSCFLSGGNGHPIWGDWVSAARSLPTPHRICSSILLRRSVRGHFWTLLTQEGGEKKKKTCWCTMAWWREECT